MVMNAPPPQPGHPSHRCHRRGRRRSLPTMTMIWLDLVETLMQMPTPYVLLVRPFDALTLDVHRPSTSTSDIVDRRLQSTRRQKLRGRVDGPLLILNNRLSPWWRSVLDIFSRICLPVVVQCSRSVLFWREAAMHSGCSSLLGLWELLTRITRGKGQRIEFVWRRNRRSKDLDLFGCRITASC